MNFRFNRKAKNLSMLFNGHYLDVKGFYVLATEKIPCVSFIGEIDVTKAYAYIKQSLDGDIRNTFQHSYYDHDSKETYFNNTIFVITNNRMIELANNYCHILHDGTYYTWARNMLITLADFRLVREQKTQTQIIGFARQAEMN